MNLGQIEGKRVKCINLLRGKPNEGHCTHVMEFPGS